eukprot:TRINITY_DN5174_c0_g1_i2.p1 TRINITY_DN5174_c0_g1~~TRINITY_DN5174_c0_g1_i2.p1  ORF type:complete len:315 (-),score=50.15 TRINITY_DN5174_c0_g1_i2:44-988(-)
MVVSSFLLWKMWTFLVVIACVIPVISSITTTDPFTGLNWEQIIPYDIDSCTYTVNFAFYVMFALTAGLFFGAAILLWPARDAYYMKWEIRFTAVMWACFLLVFFMVARNEPLQATFYPGFFIVICLYLLFIGNTVTLFYASYKSTFARSSKKNGCDTGKHDLATMLRSSPQFRTSFSEFLCLQLCIENLLFYDAVENFTKGDATLQKATELYSKFVAPMSEYEINIEGTVRTAIKEKIANNEITTSLFNDAQKEVLHVMQYSSLPQFLTKNNLSLSSSSSSSSNLSRSSTTEDVAVADDSSSSSSTMVVIIRSS